MTTIQSLTTSTAANLQPQRSMPEQKQQQTEASKPTAPTVEVSSSAALLFNALADLILGGSASGQDATSAAPVQSGKADGDEGAGGGEINDHDGDDPQMPATPNFADTGTYNFGGATA